MRPRKSIILALVLLAIALIIILTRPTESEAARVQRATEWSVQAMLLIRNKQGKTSPRLIVDLLVARTNDPSAFYDGRFDQGMERLHELGVIQHRTFQILDTNGQTPKIQIMTMFSTNDVLWNVIGPFSNGLFEVHARTSAMIPWEKLERAYAEKRARRDRD